jgi:hypothetical protein
VSPGDGNKPLIACYAPGLTNVKNTIFNKPNDNNTFIIAPKGTKITLFSEEKGAGSTLATITDYNSDSIPPRENPSLNKTLNYKTIKSLAFSSIDISAPTPSLSEGASYNLNCKCSVIS